jgi:hypothetical protein
MSDLIESRISEIRERLTAVRGSQPWRHVVGEWTALWCIADCGAIAPDLRQHCVNRPEDIIGYRGGNASANAEFIAHAPSDLEALLAEREGMKAEIERLRTTPKRAAR